jgi:cell wall-associated NlpC family hydrolase
MLYSDAGEAWGAHVGVYLGDGKIIHLSLENGRPQVIAHAAMLQIPRYAKFVGAKRIKRQIS